MLLVHHALFKDALKLGKLLLHYLKTSVCLQVIVLETLHMHHVSNRGSMC